MSTPYSPYDQGQQPAGYPPQGGYPYPPSAPPQGGYAADGPDGYLHGGRVGFGEAVRLAISNIFTYSGRASRSAYWWYALFSVIVFVAAVILMAVLKSLGVVIDVIAYIGLFLTSLSLTVRRLHDSDKSGFWYFIAFVPFVGGIALLVLTLLEGTPGPNRFG